MAIFGKKKSAETDEGAEGGNAPKTAKAGGFNPDPAKAQSWFKHAEVSHQSTNYEYAMTCWLKGLGFDPANRDALESFYKSAQAFAAKRGKPGPTKDQLKNVSGKGPVGKYQAALLNWGGKPLDASAAIKAVSSAGELQLRESAAWIGQFALRAARGETKHRKDAFVKLLDVFEKNELWELATRAGEDAVHLDPGDGPLADRVKQVSAKAAMSSGGFDESGEEGGFRKNIRNAEAQDRIRQQQQVVQTEEAAESALEEARADYESRPDDRNSILKYVRALIKRGRQEDEERAREVLLKGYTDLKEERLREQAADIQLRWGQRKLATLKKAVEAAPDDAEAKAAYDTARAEQLRLETEEYRQRVRAYPTETSYKYELGRRLFMQGAYEEAIKHLQDAQNDAKRRVAVLSLLGQSFQKLGWHTEATGMLRQAAEAHHSSDDDLGLDLRYGLLVALIGKAEEERDEEAAKEALELASAIAMKQIGYRDVRALRDTIKELLADLRGG